MGGRRFSRALHAAPRANAALAFAMCAVAVLILAACSPRPSANLLIPVEKPPRFTPKVEMLVATTRAVGDPANPFATVAERSWQLNYASHTISIPTRRTPGEIAWPDSYPPDPARHFLSVDQAVLNPASFTAQLRARAAKRDGGKVLVFVHGYNMRYQEAVYWLGQIAHDSGFSGTPILFAWPSAGKAPLYLADRESVAYSRDYFEQFLLAIAALPEVKEIDILAHSMGTWLTVEMLRQASIKGHKDFRGKLAEVILASPDLDVEVFRTQLDTIGRLRKPMTILVSGDDKALGLSRRLNGGNDRVGLITVDDWRVVEGARRYNLNVIDLTNVNPGDPTNHSKFARSGAVMAAIGSRIEESAKRDQQEAGGLVASVRSVGDALVAVPRSVLNAGTAQ